MIQHRTYHLLAFAGLLLLVLALFAGTNTLDIHLHDTYFIIGYNFVATGLGLLLLLMWLLYLPFHKSLIRSLTLVHVSLTLVCLVGLFAITAFLTGSFARTYADFSTYKAVNILVLVLLVLFITAQLVFLANIVVGLFRRLR